MAQTKSPVTFVGTGEHIDDIEPFNPRSFVSRLLGTNGFGISPLFSCIVSGLGDMGQLVETMKQHVNLEKQPEIFQRMTEGKFSLRDLREQLQTMMSLGPLGKMMQMLPGQWSQMIPKGAEPEQQFKKFLCIMDSMTNEELDNPKVLNSSRVARIGMLHRHPMMFPEVTDVRAARGSGTLSREVQAVLDMHKQFSKMGGKMKGLKNLASGKGDPASMMRNMGQMSKMINPQILKQVWTLATPLRLVRNRCWWLCC